MDFSGRTVISPDPNLPLFAVGVPELVAKEMTYPDRVTELNIEKLRRNVNNGTEIWPGANYIRSTNGRVVNLNFADKKRASAELRVGDVVERHLSNGDPVLFNRQPSLHKMSIMSHRAVVMPSRTFRFNECCCTPYNADFDGDEMNLHLPQTEEARAEAALLMDVRENLITPRSGEPLIAATQDFLTAAYLLTKRDTLLTHAEFFQAVAYLSDATEPVTIPPPTILTPVALWTGKQVITALLKPNASVVLAVTLEMRANNYTGLGGPHGGGVMCPDDGYVIFRNGELLAGSLDKSCIGSGSKRGLVFVLIRDNHASLAARCLHRLTKLCTRWLTDWGLSIGIEDVAPSPAVTVRKKALVEEGYRVASSRIAEFKNGQLTLQAGCNEEESLEALLNGVLSKLRDSIGAACMEELPRTNSPRIMATCGSKGSVLNICQMVVRWEGRGRGVPQLTSSRHVSRNPPPTPPPPQACVGQQSVGGKRIQEGFVNRTLPAFAAGAKEPAAKGFVANSFYSGLLATEFFFHTMGGREGLVDTAVKTAETGYMQRRMMKALEDLSVQYDATVRTSGGDVVQFMYGDDGLDPMYMEANGKPVDFKRVAGTALAVESARLPLRVATGPNLPASGGFQLVAGAGVAPLAPPLSPEALRALVSSHTSEAASSLLNSLVPKQFRGSDMSSGTHAAQTFLTSLRDWFETDVVGTTSTRARALFGPGRWVDFDTTALHGDELAAPKTQRRGGSASASAAAALDQEAAAVLYHTTRVSSSAATSILDVAVAKYARARVQPGEAVGAVAAHSMGEPATQMTLKTFHFAGVASMNVTLGVPRIKEIMNAARLISTPFIEAALENPHSEVAARIVKARLERTSLGDVAEYIAEVVTEGRAYLEIKLDLGAIAALQLSSVTAESVAAAIRRAPRLRLASKSDKSGLSSTDSPVQVVAPDLIQVMPPSDKKASARVRAERARKRERVKDYAERGMLEEEAGAGVSKGWGKGAKVEPGSDAEVSLGGDSPRSSSSASEEDDVIAAPRPAARGRTNSADFVARVLFTKDSGGEVLRGDSDVYYRMCETKAELPGVIVAGIPTVKRAVIQEEDGNRTGLLGAGSGGSNPGGGKRYRLLVEGEDLLRVMGTPGVRGVSSASNHIIETARVLGIEAARVVIQRELASTYNSYGISIDCRHLALLADVMTYRGEVLGITRFGIAKMKDSVLMLASFEKTPDHLFDAAVHARVDAVRGVSESIIVGTPIPLGTGLFKLLQQLESGGGRRLKKVGVARPPPTASELMEEKLRAATSALALSGV